jgi:multidrug efflux system membrane fusion protein
MRHPSPLDGQSGDCAVVADVRRDALALAASAPSRCGAAQPVRMVAIAGLAMLGAACAAKPGEAAKPAPAKTELIGHETELLRLKLSPEAEQRLGVRLVKVGSGAAQASRSTPGEVVAAPLPGGLPLAASGDMATMGAAQARADGDVARARAELAVAEKALARADALVREEAGSQRARDEAEAARGVARAAHDAARAQRALLGPAVTGLGGDRARWVRVAVFSADLTQVRRGAPAAVRTLDGGPSVLATPAAGPPGANAAAGTVDLYYALPGGAALAIGQRVAVELPTGGRMTGMTAPASAVLRDIYGGEWVYVRTAAQTYERRRIEIARLDGGQALVARGLAPGAEVVTDGAAELFGVEFGAK